MRSFRRGDVRKRGWIPTQMVQRAGPQRCTRCGRRVIPHSASPVCPGSLPKGPTQLRATVCLCFQTWPAEGTRTTAQPPLVLDSEPGAQRHRAQTSTHSHTWMGCACCGTPDGRATRAAAMWRVGLTGAHLGGEKKSWPSQKQAHLHLELSKRFFPG